MNPQQPPILADPIRPRIGIWGRFDAFRFEDLVSAWILEHELRRRLPEAHIQMYAPLERGRAPARDGGFAVADLGDWTPGRTKDLAQALDCAVVAGDLFSGGDGSLASFLVEGLGPELEKGCPVAWSAVGVEFELDPEEGARIRKALAFRTDVSVRDEASRERLRRVGVEAEVTVVPDPLLLLPRAFPPDLLARRLAYLRHMEWYPRSAAPLVVQGTRTFADRGESFGKVLATALERLQVPVVLLELDAGSGEAEFLDAVSQDLSSPTFRLPPEASSSDLVAALSHARAFVGASRRAAVACGAFGVPSLQLETLIPARARRRRDAAADVVPAVRRLLETPRGEGIDPAEESKLGAHFDRLAGIAASAVADRLRRRGDGTETLLARLRENERLLESWREAYSARAQQVVGERLVFAALLEKDRAETERLARLEAEHTSAAAEVLAERALREGAEREGAERELSGERESSARATAEARELAESKDRAEREIGNLRRLLEAAAEQASRREKRASEDLLALRTELDRSRDRLEKARSDHSDLRLSHTLLYTEIAELRADAGHSTDRVREIEAALADSEREKERAVAELSRLEAERARARQEIEELEAELDRLSARSPQQIPTSLKIRVRQMLASAAGEPREQT